MFVARSVASLRSRRLLPFFLFTLNRKKSIETFILSCPISPRPFPGDNATCTINADFGPREPEHLSGEMILPPARRAEQVRSTVSQGLLCDRGTVPRRTLEAPAPSHRLAVNPPLLVHPRFENDTCDARLNFCKSTATGGTAPGPVNLALSTSRSRAVRAPLHRRAGCLELVRGVLLLPAHAQHWGCTLLGNACYRGDPPEREYEELPYDACAPKAARRQQQRLKQPGRHNREASWAPFASAFGKPHHRDSAEFSTPLPRLFSTNSLRELWQAPCFWEFYTCQVSLRGIGRFLAATST